MLKSLRITFNGFTVNQHKNAEIKSIVNSIKQMKANIKTFSFHTCDLTGVNHQDFEFSFALCKEVGNSNEDFSLQCANWVFKGNPPNI